MVKIDFRKVEVETNFDGTKEEIDISKQLANYAKLKTSDIAFEDFCRDIYYNGEVDISEQYKQELLRIVKDSNFLAFVKRGIINSLNKV